MIRLFMSGTAPATGRYNPFFLIILHRRCSCRQTIAVPPLSSKPRTVLWSITPNGQLIKSRSSPGKTDVKYPVAEHIQLCVYDTDEEEADGIAKEIAEHGRARWGQTTVLACTKGLLERMNAALRTRHVPSFIAQRRDDFLSPQFRWLVAVLRQLARPLDRRNLAVLIEAFNRIAEISVSVEQVIAEAETIGRSYFVTWIDSASRDIQGTQQSNLLTLLATL